MIPEIKLRVGLQVLYAPAHARDSNGAPLPTHDALEFGFVTAWRLDPVTGNTNVCCRFWMQGKEGRELRTVANGEWCSQRDLFHDVVTAQEDVAREVDRLARQPGAQPIQGQSDLNTLNQPNVQ
jgi:hypothetical protein